VICHGPGDPDLSWAVSVSLQSPTRQLFVSCVGFYAWSLEIGESSFIVRFLNTGQRQRETHSFCGHYTSTTSGFPQTWKVRELRRSGQVQEFCCWSWKNSIYYEIKQTTVAVFQAKSWWVILDWIFITSANNVEVMWSFCYSVNRIADECGNRCRPNLAGMGKRWTTVGGDPGLHVDSRSIFCFLCHCGMGYILTFVSTSHTINGRFVPYVAKWLTPTR